MKFSLELRELCYWCAKLVELREVRCCCMKFNVEFSDLWCWCIKLEVELSKSNVRVWSWMLSCVISDIDVWCQMFYPLWIWSWWSWMLLQGDFNVWMSEIECCYMKLDVPSQALESWELNFNVVQHQIQCWCVKLNVSWQHWVLAGIVRHRLSASWS